MSISNNIKTEIEKLSASDELKELILNLIEATDESYQYKSEYNKLIKKYLEDN